MRWGRRLDEEVLREHPPREEFFNLWDAEWHKRNFGKKTV